VRFRFIEEQRGAFPTDRLCCVMNVNPRGLRAFRSRPASRRQRVDMVVLAHIKEQSRLSLGSYGRTRMTEEPKGCAAKWAGDISYIWAREGWLYLAVILHLHSRRVIGWAVSNRMKRGLAIRALKMATALRLPPKGCIFHSDRGSQYCSHDYQKILREHGFKVSMGGKGNCYDNAAVETFFKTIKAERYRYLRIERPSDEDRARGTPDPAGTIHLPDWADREWLKQLVAEQLVTIRDKRGYAREAWQKMRERSEALDATVYARAAAWIIGADRFDERMWRQLEKQAGGRDCHCRAKHRARETNTPRAGQMTTPRRRGWKISTPRYME
jgi:putative transposase